MKVARLLRKFAPAAGNCHMPGFDEIYYRYWYRDTEQYPGTPLEHYLNHGWKEGRDPSAGFSTDGYLAANSDVKANKLNPLSHFLQFGLAEGRKGWEKDRFAPAPAPRYLHVNGSQKLLPPPSRNQ